MIRFNHEKKYCVLLGEFNLDLLKFESHPSTENFLNTNLGSYYFQPQILQPTRITDHSTTLSDNIFFSSLEHFYISGNLCYDSLSDHLPNFLIVRKLSSLPANIKVFQCDYSNFYKQALYSYWHSINKLGCLTSRCLQTKSCMFDSFYNKISEVIEYWYTHTMIKQSFRKELKSTSKPWITSGIRTSIR